MPNGDPFHALEQLADVQDVHQLDDLLHPARCAGRELYSLKIGERRSYGPRLEKLMSQVEHNPVFHDVRATRALEVLADVFARLA